jgi:hypothetical protein
MANVRIQPSRALTVYKSDDADIPYPALAVAGTTDGTGTNELIDSTVNFVNVPIYPGNIVYNTTTSVAATIIGVPTATPNKLILNADIFVSGDNYVIYQSSPMAGGQNTGCVLYIGTGGDVVVTMAGNDIVTFFNVQDGTFMPVQVLKVWDATTAEDIIALW